MVRTQVQLSPLLRVSQGCNQGGNWAAFSSGGSTGEKNPLSKLMQVDGRTHFLAAMGLKAPASFWLLVISFPKPPEASLSSLPHGSQPMVFIPSQGESLQSKPSSKMQSHITMLLQTWHLITFAIVYRLEAHHRSHPHCREGGGGGFLGLLESVHHSYTFAH